MAPCGSGNAPLADRKYFGCLQAYAYKQGSFVVCVHLLAVGLGTVLGAGVLWAIKGDLLGFARGMYWFLRRPLYHNCRDGQMFLQSQSITDAMVILWRLSTAWLRVTPNVVFLGVPKAASSMNGE